MPQLPICPICDEPVADQPVQDWTSAYRGGGAPWWHLIDNTPICLTEGGTYPQAVFVEDGLPADTESHTWLVAMSELFAIVGPYDPARLGSAITAADHLTRWLFTATGPFSALLALRTPADVAALIGHLHRTTRLLARVHAQTSPYLLDQTRQPHFAGLDPDSEVRAEVIDAADDVHADLQDAADWSLQSAQALGIALSHARKVAALTMTASAGSADEHESSGNPATGTTEPTSSGDPQQVLDTSGRHDAHLGELIGSTFGDEAGFSPELTHSAARILGTLTTYLSNCLGAGRSAAIPTSKDLADLATSLTYATHTLVSGLRHLTESPRGSETNGLDETDAAATRASLKDAVEGLRFAANHLAAASYTAAGLDPQGDQQ
ncbi:hypothetical protein KIF24_28545 [Micromonospora sp. Llam7]|uniref:hypothetical protein n=1 Tax=Micromonospora tarapacensis TaxID=2835305 RepID=UPI001C829135|nr:hypothetical protein [Micromonospora tarapacensis]MBX7269569.1 hypothetical protein [Micromonospora tarapacensis]